MAKPKTKTYEKFRYCIQHEINSWDKTMLSPLEAYARKQQIIWGIFVAALYLLQTDEYLALQQWCEDTYGFSNRGVRGGSK